MSDENKPGTDLVETGSKELVPKAHGTEGIERLEKLMSDSGTHMVLHEPEGFHQRLQRIEAGDVEDGVNLGVLGKEGELVTYLATPDPYDFSVFATGSSVEEAVDNLKAQRVTLMDLQFDTMRSGAKFLRVRVYALNHVTSKTILSPFDDPE